MKTAPALLSLLLPLGLFADRVAFAPSEGSALTKTFTGDFEIELDDLSLVIGGQELDPSMFGDPSVAISLRLESAVTDEYVGVANGRPTELKRTFDTIGGQVDVESSGGGESDSQSDTAVSPLEGATVVFKWDEDEGAYLKEFAEGDGDEELLEGLEEDMDLRFLLPEGEVEEGDSWTIDSETLKNIVTPGGDLALEPEDGADEENEELNEAMSQILSEIFAGEATATYNGMRDDDKAVIGLAVEIDSSLDVGDMIRDLMESDGDEMDLQMANVLVTFDGEGELVWNTSENRLHAFELSGDALIELDVELANDQMGTLEAAVELSGSMAFSAATE